MKLPPGYVPGQGVRQASAYGGFGERLLQRLGWEKGQALGLTGTGLKQAIEVKKKEDTSGIGANARYQWEEKWWESVYNTAAQDVDRVAQEAASSSGSDSDASSGDEFQPLQTRRHRDGTAASATADELRIAAELAKDPWGRFGGRAGKMARIAQQEQQQAALLRLRLEGTVAAEGSSAAAAVSIEAASLPVPNATAAGSKRKWQAVSPACESPEVAAPAAVVKKSKKSKASKPQEQAGAVVPAAVNAVASSDAAPHKKQRKASKLAAAASEEAQVVPVQQRKTVVIEPQAHATAAAIAAAFVATPARGWWGANYFASAGCLGGLNETAQHVARERQTFDEDDQADLWMKAQSGKTANKTGLGVGGPSDKLKGPKWEGTRVEFTDEAAPDTEAAQGTRVQQAQGGASNTSSASTEQLNMLSGCPAASPAASVKWKKLTAAALQKASGQRMSLKKLRKQVIAAVVAKELATSPELQETWEHQWLAKVRSSSQFIVDGKYIQLVAS